jgi:glycosyltransferase involved in cell wall biosynthesis
MNIGLAIETDIPGGAETMLLELAVELRSAGHEVTPLGFAGMEGWLTERFAQIGMERELLELKGTFGLGSTAQLAETIRARRLDVVHSHEFGFAICGALACRAAGCRHVITMHGGDYYGGRLRRRLALRAAAAGSDRIVAVSKALRSRLSAAIGMHEADIAVVHNGVAPTVGTPGRLRAELGLDRSHVVVLAVGNLFTVKGHEVLVRAVSRLGDLPEAVVAIAGRGYLDEELRALASDLGVADRVHFLGFRKDVNDLLADADIFAMPSLNEGLPMAMIEAMLAGKAIVGSNVGGIPELIDSEEVGLLVPARDDRALAEVLARLVREPALRERLGSAAEGRASAHFTAAAMAERYLEIYRGR